MLSKPCFPLLFFACWLFVMPVSGDAVTLKNDVVVPASITWPPYVYVSDDQQLSGPDIDLLRRVLTRIGYSLRHVHVPLKRMMANNDGLGINANFSTTYSAARAEKYYYSIPYRREQVAIFYVADKFDAVTTLAEFFKQARLIALNTAGYFGETFQALSDSHREKLVHSETAQRRLRQLASGRVDIMVGDVPNIEYWIATEGLTGIKQSSFLVSEKDQSYVFLKTAFDEAFMAKFNQVLREELNASQY